MNEFLLDIKKQTGDAERFVTWFTGSACTDSTPHIYISALPFCPHISSVYKNYSRQMQGLMHVLGSKTVQTGRTAPGTQTTGAFIYCVTFSPDGSSIASGSSDHTIRVWDTHTGAVAGSFEGHTDEVHSVAFSPDGTHIASGSSDHTIRVWDACTGEAVAGPFEGHTGWVSYTSSSRSSEQL